MKSLWFCLLFFYSCVVQSCIFQGLLEDSSVKQNTFFCPKSGQDMPQCKNAGEGAIGYTLSQSDLLQFFNNQSYWIMQQASQAQDAVGYTQTQKAEHGWPAMGGYCIIVTTNQILTDLVMPAVTANKGQVKVVVQLWYNGNSGVELWSQDALVIENGKGFQVLISSDVDSAIAALPAQTNNTFLGQLHLQINNRGSEYAQATQSPRSVKIQAQETAPVASS